MHTSTSIWSSRNERKTLLWLIRYYLGIIFFFNLVVFVVACTCEVCITFFVGLWCRCAQPELCVVQPCSVPSGTQLEPPARGSAGCAAPQGCLAGTGTALLVAVPRAWHHLQSCCHHPVSPARSWCCSWLARRHSRTKLASHASKWVNGGCNFVAQSLLLLGCQPGF